MEGIMVDSKQTVDLLDKLVKLGFNDDAFWRLHHKREPTEKRPHPVPHKIKEHRRYCDAGHIFNHDEENERVYRRLAFVWKIYTDIGFSYNETNVFIALAEAAFVAIPTHKQS